MHFKNLIKSVSEALKETPDEHSELFPVLHKDFRDAGFGGLRLVLLGKVKGHSEGAFRCWSLSHIYETGHWGSHVHFDL